MGQEMSWNYGRLAVSAECSKCTAWIGKGDWGYNDPKGKLHCTRCAAGKSAKITPTLAVQKKKERIAERVIDFLAGELSRKIKKP